MQKNLILAVVLSSLVYIGWYSYMEKKLPPPASQSSLEASAAASEAAAGTMQAEMRKAGTAATPAPGNSKILPGTTGKFLIPLRAGRSSYTFFTPNASISAVVYAASAPAELVPQAGSGFFATTFPAVFALKNRTENTMEFAADLPGGVRLTKKFAISPDNGLNSIEITATNTSSKPQDLAPWELTIGPGLGTVESDKRDNAKLCKANYTFSETGRKHPTIAVLKDEPAQSDWVWTGLNNRYFLAALAGGNMQNTRPFRRLEKVGENLKTPTLVVPVPAAELKPGEKRVWEAQFYLGPKDYPLLRKLGLGLDRSVDFGMFAPLAKLANSTLAYLYKLTGNYGVSIILLSLMIQLILTPLSLKSQKSMAIMKKLQPEMQSIQKRYKDDPKRMNQEVMDLYKRHGTNPLGGCLPMLLQIPVFFALFTALRNSWNLNGAPFIFWIKDLSAKDPFYVLPLIMGGIMFLQQHLNPQTSDPSQAAMMKWMPVIFTFMFLTFPSGLVLYWLVNSTWGFAQSMYLQKKMA